jgi:DNA replication protein DnaC
MVTLNLETSMNETTIDPVRLLTLKSQWEAICPPLYRDTDVDRLPQPATGKVLSWEHNPKGLLIAGDTGKGKTRATYSLLRRLHFEGRTIAAFDAISFGHRCSTAFKDPEQGMKWIHNLCRADILFLDDFGKIKMTDRVESELFGLVELRVSHLKPIIVTTNASGATLEDMLSADRGAPLVRRLREFCTVVLFV